MGIREEARERTRERVLDCADHCFRTTGFEATTIRQIAEEAGVSVGSVMAVGDKQALLIEVFDRGISAIHRNAGRGELRDTQDLSIVDELLALVLPFIELFVADPPLSKRYAAALVAGEHRSTVFSELAEALIREFHAAFERAGCTPDVAEARARASYFAYLGLLFSASGRHQSAPSTTTLSDELRTAFAAIAAHRQETR
jgi:AcrR family transcriptional regulator